VTLTTTTAVVVGTYSLTLDGSSGGQSASVQLTVQVQPALPASFAQIEQHTFNYFWDTANASNGLAPDHYSTSAGPSPYASIAATGFALSAYPIGVQNGWVTRAQAAQRVLTTLNFLTTHRRAALPAAPAAMKDFSPLPRPEHRRALWHHHRSVVGGQCAADGRRAVRCQLFQ